MANEFQTDHPTPGTAIDGYLWDGGQIWNGSTFVAPAADDWATYALPFTEIAIEGGPSHYVLSFPTAITTAKVYALKTTVRAGDDPAPDDEQHGYTVAIAWDGASEVVGLINAAGGGVRFGSGGGNQVA